MLYRHSLLKTKSNTQEIKTSHCNLHPHFPRKRQGVMPLCTKLVIRKAGFNYQDYKLYVIGKSEDYV